MNIFDSLPLNITSYYCTICKKHHRKGSKLFKLHYDKHFDKDNNYIGIIEE